MASNLSADSGTSRQRERFASPMVVALVVGTGLAMLVALYPEKEIVSMLGRTEEPSPAVMRYLEALVRIRPDNALLRIELARIYIKIECPEKALGMTYGVDSRGLSAQELKNLETIRYQAALQRLYLSTPDDPAWEEYRSEYAALVEKRIKGKATRTELGAMLSDAEMAGDKGSVRRIASIIGPGGPAGMRSGDSEADEAAGKQLSAGNYRAAADAYISFMAKRNSLPEKKRLFIAALASLQSGNQPLEALKMAESHIGIFGNDRETLMFVTRLALAANRPEVAQKYVRRALGMRTQWSEG